PSRKFALWRFDPKSANPLTGPVRTGVLPSAFDANTTLTGIQPLIPIDDKRSNVPGTIDFLRTKVKHVVYYMIENRSFDHICGWLYENGGEHIRFIGCDGPYDGASTKMFNIDPGAQSEDKRVVPLAKYLDGKLDSDAMLDFLPNDPYHDKTDVMRQFFFANR